MQKDETANGEVKEKKSVITSIIVGGVGAFSAVYLLNPTAGFLELIPDNLPVVGNLDEAAAAALLISCLAYFGVDIGGLFGRKKKEESDIIDVEARE
ncbi:MAG: DUF1232 domain-containing protein [Verrucomicrobiales bacterium]|nr:DUF1232 domain-containing protein [Verrucomicrobiales bacterium]